MSLQVWAQLFEKGLKHGPLFCKWFYNAFVYKDSKFGAHTWGAQDLLWKKRFEVTGLLSGRYHYRQPFEDGMIRLIAAPHDYDCP